MQVWSLNLDRSHKKAPLYLISLLSFDHMNLQQFIGTSRPKKRDIKQLTCINVLIMQDSVTIHNYDRYPDTLCIILKAGNPSIHTHCKHRSARVCNRQARIPAENDPLRLRWSTDHNRHVTQVRDIRWLEVGFRWGYSLACPFQVGVGSWTLGRKSGVFGPQRLNRAANTSLSCRWSESYSQKFKTKQKLVSKQ